MYTGLMEYLEQSPYLEGQTFNFDFLGSQPLEYSLSIPTNVPELATHVNGDKRCQQTFYLQARLPWGEDIRNNINNLEFFQKVKRWFENQNKRKNLPDLGPGKTATKVIASTDGYLENTTGGTGRYQIQGQVEYIQEVELIEEDRNLTKMPWRW